MSTLDDFFHPNVKEIKVNYIGFTDKGNLYHVDEYGKVTQIIGRARVVNSYYFNFVSKSEEKDNLGFPIVIKELVVKKTVWLMTVIKLTHLKYQKESFCKIRIPLLTFARLCSINVNVKILEVK